MIASSSRQAATVSDQAEVRQRLVGIRRMKRKLRLQFDLLSARRSPGHSFV
jgi:hypothetical protein